ncbi:tripartite tricarboxylate transporter TctB family protein [Allohahella marinimesophila]|uniref:DUF1468 domain-containing protein n=1 Tax=Allohahella marinimesophila TaxID=1054972 RepID=A0ABP7NIE3_9GAMM
MSRLIDRSRYWHFAPDFEAGLGRGLESLAPDRRLDFILAVVSGFLGLAVALFLVNAAFGESSTTIFGMRSPFLFPAIAAVLMCGICGLLLRRVVKGRSTALAEEAAPADLQSAKAGWIGLSILVYGVLVFVLGMLLSSMLFIVVASLLFGYRNIWGIAALSIMTPVSIYLLFERLLNILLPSGWIF